LFFVSCCLLSVVLLSFGPFPAKTSESTRTKCKEINEAKKEESEAKEAKRRKTKQKKKPATVTKTPTHSNRTPSSKL